MGMVLTVRGSSISAIADDFNRADGPLVGSKTTIGKRAWSKPSSGDTVASIVNQQLLCTEGTLTDTYLIDVDAVDYDFGVTLSSRGVDEVKHSLVFRVTDEANHMAVLFRQTGTIKGYCIANRLNGIYTYPLITGVVPKIGDVVSVSVLNNTATLYINGKSLGIATLPTGTPKTTLGIRIAGADRESAFDSLTVRTKPV